MLRSLPAWGFIALAVLAMACSGGAETAGGSASGRSAEFQQGGELFGQHCSLCHGAVGEGADVGPPLVHAIYKPDHHPDFSFRNAVNNGVPQHHWAFGDMPPRPGLSASDVDSIICYIRQLQAEGGIFEGPGC